LPNGIKNSRIAATSKMVLYERKSRAARSQVIMFFYLLLHRPSDGVAIILKLNPAGCSQPDHTFAGVVIGKELVCRAEAAGLVSPVVVVSGKENLISKSQRLAVHAGEPHLQILGCGGVRQPVLFHRFVDHHGLYPPFSLFSLSVCTYSL